MWPSRRRDRTSSWSSTDRHPNSLNAPRPALPSRLRARPGLFHAVRRPDAGPFWAHNGLLFASTDDVRSAIAELIKAQPFLGPLASDPSLRGLADALSLVLRGGRTISMPHAMILRQLHV